MAGTRLYIIVSFFLPMVLLAPFAWKLTRVDRSPLPFDSIENLVSRSLPMDHHFSAHLHFFFVSSKNNEQDHTKNLWNEETIKEWKQNFQLVDFNKNKKDMNHYHIHETPLDLDLSHVNSTSSMEELDEFFYKLVQKKLNPLEYSFFIFCDDDHPSLNTWFVGRHLHAWMNHCDKKFDFKPLNQMIQTILIPSPTFLNATARVALSYRLAFSLVNEDPSEFQYQWDFPKLAETYISPFIEKVSVLANFSITSQILHYAQLANKVRYNAKGDFHFVTTLDLQQFMSANDWTTSSVVSDREQILQFLAYLPSRSHSPLFVRHPKKAATTLSSSNSEVFSKDEKAFEIPGWGGVAIVNTNLDQSLQLTKDQIQQFMATFVAQCRHLLGAPGGRSGSITSIPNVVFLPSTVDGITDWEIAVIVRAWTFRHIQSTIKTLTSIAKLVTDMPHMHVLERIQSRVVDSLSYLEKALALQSEEIVDYKGMLELSRAASGAADAAYYDSTMVPQLYFPEEHIYAVYFPLLAPLILPLILGLCREYNRYQTKMKQKKKEQ